MKIVGAATDLARAPERLVGPKEAAEQPQVQPKGIGASEQVSRDELEQIAEKMNAAAQVFNKAIEFKVVEGNRLIIKVIDTTTDEVITEFPPERLVEAFLAMEASLGLLLDKKV